MKRTHLIIAAIILLLIGTAIIMLNKRDPDDWDSYPKDPIVDTPEEFQRKNTP